LLKHIILFDGEKHMFKWGYPSPQWDNEMGSSPIRLLLELVLVLKMYPLVIKRCWLEIEHFI